jgi:hypothetical protein
MSNVLGNIQPKKLSLTGKNADIRDSEASQPNIEGQLDEYDEEDLGDYEPEEDSRWTSVKINELDVSDLLNQNNP